MWLKTLKIYNFRGFFNEKFEFVPRINIITGLNATGKTTLLESIFYLGVCKSFKTNTEFELIKEKESEMSVIGDLDTDFGAKKLQVLKTEKGKKASINGFVTKKISDYIGEMPVICFSNEDMIRLVTSSKNRRYLFEPLICQISKDYIVASNYYKKILNNRNELLKRLTFEKNSNLIKMLETLNEQMVFYAKKIIVIRKKVVDKINTVINNFHKKICSSEEFVFIKYLNNVEPEEMLGKIKEKQEEEIKKGTTLIGPHKDDFEFIVNEKNVVNFGSQGQQRNCIISFKLACAEIIKITKNEYPILLLDDVFSELDGVRQNKLFNAFDDKTQVFISSSTIKEIDKKILENTKIIELKQGGISRG